MSLLQEMTVDCEVNLYTAACTMFADLKRQTPNGNLVGYMCLDYTVG